MFADSSRAVKTFCRYGCGMTAADDLAARARQVIDANLSMALGASEPDGRPRISPLYFTHAGYRDFSWVSSPAAAPRSRARGY